jgi:hypothetical protein
MYGALAVAFWNSITFAVKTSRTCNGSLCSSLKAEPGKLPAFDSPIREQCAVPQVTVQHGKIPHGDIPPRGDQPLRWALHAQSRRVIHVSMLQRKQKGLACGCVCPGCGEELEAVNAGRDPSHFTLPNTLGQFFRHGRGHQKDNCLLLAGRLAALQLLFERGEVEIPAA